MASLQEFDQKMRCMPINYLNLYLFSIFGGLLATLGGIWTCYSGMSGKAFWSTKEWKSQRIILIKIAMTSI